MDSTTPTQRPKLRDLAPENLEEITYGLVWTLKPRSSSERLPQLGDDEDRLGIFVNKIGKLQPLNRAKVLAHIDSYLVAHSVAEGNAIWHSLKDEVTRNEYFGGSDWALRGELAAMKIWSNVIVLPILLCLTAMLLMIGRRMLANMSRVPKCSTTLKTRARKSSSASSDETVCRAF
jgi:hypothetical protein